MLVLLIVFLYHYMYALWTVSLPDSRNSNKGATDRSHLQLLHSHSLLQSCRTSYNLQGSYTKPAPDFITPPLGNLALLWQAPFSQPPPKFAYPSLRELHFPGCITVQLWFYNMILRASGLTLVAWIFQTTKTIVPRCREDLTLQDTFRYDPPPIRWNL